MSFDWQQDHTARVETYHDDDSYTFQKKAPTFTSTSTLLSSYAQEEEVASTFTSMQRTAQFNSDKNRMKKFEWKKDDVAKAHEASGVTSILFTACGRFLVSSGNDHRVRLWSSNTGYLHSINYNVSCASTLPFTMEIISDFSSGADDVLAHPSGEDGDIALVALHSPSGKPFKRLTGHLGAVTCIAYRRGHGQLITAAKDGMVYIWDASASQRERESRVDDGSQREKGRRNTGTGTLANNNDDSWSDGGAISGDEERQRGPPRYFVPPIVQRYLEDAAESKKQLQLEQQRVAAARASMHRPGMRGHSTYGGERGGGGRGVGGMATSSSSTPHGSNRSSEHYESSSKYLNSTSNSFGSSSSSSSSGHAQAHPRSGTGRGTGMRVKYKMKAKDKDRDKDKSVRERAEIIFALAAASALRNTTSTSSSTTSSSSNTISADGPSSSMRASGSISSDSSTHALPLRPPLLRTANAAAAAATAAAATAAAATAAAATAAAATAAAVNSSSNYDKAPSSSVTLCQREKEKEEKNKKVVKVRKEKSKLTCLREKYSAPSKKPRR